MAGISFPSSFSISLNTLIPYEHLLLRWMKYKCILLDSVFKTVVVVYTMGLLYRIHGHLWIPRNIKGSHPSYEIWDSVSAVSEDFGALKSLSFQILRQNCIFSVKLMVFFYYYSENFIISQTVLKQSMAPFPLRVISCSLNICRMNEWE